MAGCEIVMGFRFNPPPNWPAPPEGWVPPAGMEAAARVARPPAWLAVLGRRRCQPAIPALLARFRCPAGRARSMPGMGRPMAGQALRRSHQLRSSLQVLPIPRCLAPVRAAARRREEKPGIFAGHKRAESLQQEISDLARENERLRQQVTACWE